MAIISTTLLTSDESGELLIARRKVDLAQSRNMSQERVDDLRASYDQKMVETLAAHNVTIPNGSSVSAHDNTDGTFSLIVDSLT